MRVLFGLSVLAILIAAGCSSPSNSPTSSLTGTPYYPSGTGGAVSCSAMVNGTPTGNQISVTVYAQGGTAPYTVTSMTVNGAQAQLSGATQFSGQTTVTGITSYTTGGTGTITLIDGYSSPATCTFSTTGTGLYPTPTPTPYYGSGSCQIAFSANPISRGSQVDVYAYNASGSLVSVYGPTGYGISGNLTGYNSARLYFPSSGQFLLTMYLSNGGSCQGYMTVY